MTKAKSKPINAYFVHANTPIRAVKSGGAYCLAFNFPTSRAMIGLAVEKADVARFLSRYFADVAERLEKNEKAAQ